MISKGKRLASALLVIGFASLAGGALAATPHSDDGHASAVQELRLDQGK
jgi:hypothetical protein